MRLAAAALNTLAPMATTAKQLVKTRVDLGNEFLNFMRSHFLMVCP